MGKFSWRRSLAYRGLFRNNQFVDISSNPTSPSLDTDHTVRESFAASVTSPIELPDRQSPPHPPEKSSSGTSLNSNTSTGPPPQDIHHLFPEGDFSISVPAPTAPTAPTSLLSARPLISVVENSSDYNENETPRAFVERRLSYTSIASPEIPDDFPFYQSASPKIPESFGGNEASPVGAPPYQPLSLRAFYKEFGFWIFLTGLQFCLCLCSMWWADTALGHTSWAGRIRSGDHSLSAITTLVSLNSKFIEVLSLGMYTVATGQYISRRALSRTSKGIDLSAMSIKLWITRPGTLLTHWTAVKCAVRNWPKLAMLSILTLVAGLSYTSASNALVLPRLANTLPQPEVLWGLVQSSYANPEFIQQSCQSPITPKQDPEYEGYTCLSMQHVGQAYHNYLGYFQSWLQVKEDFQALTDISSRPPVTGQLSGNTTVQGSWIEAKYSNIGLEPYNRVVNNVTVAVPHPGVVSAASNPMNSVIQPQNMGTSDQYSFRAAIPSPTLNVLCVNMDLDEVAPMVYTQWPGAKTESTDIPGWKIPASMFWEEEIPTYSDHEWLNKTAVDDIFGWGEKYDRKPPVFSALPIDYNTITNTSMYYGDSTYMLLKSNDTPQYTVCSMRVFLYYNCNTEYTVSGAFANLKTNCDDSNENFAYSKFVPDAPITISHDYPNIASNWALALALNDGAFAANSSNARLLTEFVVHGQSLDPSLPSAAEAIAVLALNTLLVSMAGSPFVHYWQYNETILDPGVYQSFNASVITSQYYSQASSNWEYIFALSLIWIALVNCLVFCHLVYCGLITDYTEEENLFALGISVPENDLLAEHCVHDHMCGPEAALFERPFWITRRDGNGHSHFTGHPQEAVRCDDEGHNWPTEHLRRWIKKLFSSQATAQRKRGVSSGGDINGTKVEESSLCMIGINSDASNGMQSMARRSSMDVLSIQVVNEDDNFV